MSTYKGMETFDTEIVQNDTIYYISSHPSFKEPDTFEVGVETDSNGKTYRTKVIYREYAPRTYWHGHARLSDYLDQERTYQEGQKRTGTNSQPTS